jgi:hypothetical protein
MNPASHAIVWERRLYGIKKKKVMSVITVSLRKRAMDRHKSDENRKEVIQNDRDIHRQVPGILNDHLGTQKPEALRNQELYYRAINR